MTRYNASLFVGKELYEHKSDFVTICQLIEWVGTKTGNFRLDIAKLHDGEEKAWTSLLTVCKDGHAAVYQYSLLNWHEVSTDDIELILN